MESRPGAGGPQKLAAEKAGEVVIPTPYKLQRALRIGPMLATAPVALSMLCSLVVSAQTTRSRAHVEALASPRLEGRLAGSNGERLAADYLVSQLVTIGA